MPFVPDDSLPRVQRALEAELNYLNQDPQKVAPLERVELAPPDPTQRPTRLAVVAADAVRPARAAWGKKCPVCVRHDQDRRELFRLFTMH